MKGQWLNALTLVACLSCIALAVWLAGSRGERR